MKIGIVTIHNVSNYGAVLQSYALKEALKTNAETYIVNFDNRFVSNSLDYLRVAPSIRGLLGLGKDLLRIFPRIRVINKFNNFLADNMDLVEFEMNVLEDFDGFVSGSDQIWNPACIDRDANFRLEYFLNFATESQFKISYASSCGAYQFNNEELRTISKNLANYKALSVRESHTAEMMHEKLGFNVEHVLDPTLLLTKDDWLNKLGDNRFRNGDYILLYVIKKTPLLIKTVNHFKSSLGLKVILVEQGLYFSRDVDEHIRDAGPKDFISLFNNAKYVITDSFHGTTFSLIFNKPFLTVSPGQNINRIESLLSKLHLNERIIHNENQIHLKSFDFTFSNANDLLKLEIAKSKKFLLNSLN